MTWTTSADPWARGIRKEAQRALTPNHLRLLITDTKFIAAAVPALAVGHLFLIAILSPAFATPEAGALLLLSGMALLAAAVAAIRSRIGQTTTGSQETRASPVCFVPPAAIQSEPAPSTTHSAARVEAPSLGVRTCTFRPNAHNPDWADLMARVSHELRTPLNAVLGFSDLMDRGTFGPLGHHRYQEYARHIHESGRDLLKSAEDTLAVTSLLTASSQKAACDVTDFADVANDAWAFFGRLPQTKGVALEIAVPAGTEIVCDRRSIRQVLVNLMSEALTRSAPGSSIKLAAQFDFGQIGVIISVPYAPSQALREPGSLDVCLARTLLEFHGAPLIEHLSEQSGWRATTYLERADQADFFAARPGMLQQPALV